MSETMDSMKGTIVGGLVAGLVAGSIVAGAVVMTSGGGGGPVEVYGNVGVNNGWSGSTYDAVFVEPPRDPYSQAADGSKEHPFYITHEGILTVRSCENYTPSLVQGVPPSCD